MPICFYCRPDFLCPDHHNQLTPDEKVAEMEWLILNAVNASVEEHRQREDDHLESLKNERRAAEADEEAQWVNLIEGCQEE